MKPVALVVGAGDALGGAIARRFAREGHATVVCRRHLEALQPLQRRIEAEGGEAHAFACDARREEQVTALYQQIEAEIGPLDVVVFNVGGNVRFQVVETTAQKYFKVWEMAAFAGFLTGREAAKVMLPRGQGTILFTGATASLRGGIGFSAFAGAKHALRALSQSMARELGPQGIHVAHVVIDGPIDTAFVREGFPGLVASRPADGLLSPDDIGKTTGCCTSSRAAPERSNWICVPGWNPGRPPAPTCNRSRKKQMGRQDAKDAKPVLKVVEVPAHRASEPNWSTISRFPWRPLAPLASWRLERRLLG